MRLRPGLFPLFSVALWTAVPTVSATQTPPPAAEAASADDDVPALSSSLDGLEQAAVRAKLGDPTLARTEGAGAFWTYRLSSCALFVYFSDAGQGLRVNGAAAGPRRHGDPTPDIAACILQAERPRPALPLPDPAQP